MKFQSQLTTGNLGNTKWSIRSYGCLTACYATILEVDIHTIAGHAEYYDSSGLLTNPQKLCDDFGGEWNSNRGELNIRPVIVETKFDGTMHFIVWTGDRFYDPLSTNGNPLRDYKIISFRNVKKKGGNNMRYDLFRDPSGAIYERLNNYALVHIPDPDFLKRYYGDNPKVQEVDNIWSVGWIAEDPRPLETKITDLQNQVNALLESVKEKTNKIADLQKETDATIKGLSDKIDQLNKDLTDAQLTDKNQVEAIVMLNIDIEKAIEAKDKAMKAQGECLKSKAKLFGEFDSIYEKNIIIPKNILKRLLEQIKSWIKKGD